MKLLILLLFIFFRLDAIGQLKEENFLLVVDSTKKVQIHIGAIQNSKFITIKQSGFKYEDNLSFYYYPLGLSYCCNYYEVKSIPKEWNIITVKDIVAHMEDKANGFRFNTKKLFFVEYDKDRKIYKAYQVDIIGWPRDD